MFSVAAYCALIGPESNAFTAKLLDFFIEMQECAEPSALGIDSLQQGSCFSNHNTVIRILIVQVPAAVYRRLFQ